MQPCSVGFPSRRRGEARAGISRNSTPGPRKNSAIGRVFVRGVRRRLCCARIQLLSPNVLASGRSWFPLRARDLVGTCWISSCPMLSCFVRSESRCRSPFPIGSFPWAHTVLSLLTNPIGQFHTVFLCRSGLAWPPEANLFLGCWPRLSEGSTVSAGVCILIVYRPQSTRQHR